MKIRINKDIVEFIPEHAAETAELEALWVKMGNCVGKTKQLEPMGVYVPSEKNVAVFHIEGLSDTEKNEIPVIRAPYDTDVYCADLTTDKRYEKNISMLTCVWQYRCFLRITVDVYSTTLTI